MHFWGARVGGVMLAHWLGFVHGGWETLKFMATLHLESEHRSITLSDKSKKTSLIGCECGKIFFRSSEIRDYQQTNKVSDTRFVRDIVREAFRQGIY